MNKEIQILELQKCNLEIYINTSYSNTEIQNTNLKKYNLQKCRNINDMTTEIQVTFELQGVDKHTNKQTDTHTHINTMTRQ